MQPVIFLVQLAGPCLIIVSMAMLSRPKAMMALVESLLQNPPLLFVLGIIQLILGLAIILAQDVASGSTLALVMTSLGWWLTVRAIMLMFLSQNALWAIFDSVEIEKYHYASNASGLVMGCYLTYVGFAASWGLAMPPI